MVFYNIFSIAVFITVIVLMRYGFFYIAGFLTFAELILHAVLSVYFIGWNSGFQYYILIVPLAIFINPLSKHPLHIGFTAFWFLASAGLFITFRQLSFYTTPPYILKDPLILILHHFNLFCFIVLLMLTAFYFSLYVRRSEIALKEAHGRSEQLLHNILPPKIADRLKESESTIADQFEEVSVLFLDVVDFTKMSSKLSAEDVVSMLNEIFCLFDQLTDTYGLEKIKTIGDAYMAVAGIPDPVNDHAERSIRMAMDMLKTLKEYSRGRTPAVRARIGICSGPVVAGVIGRHKFIYDLWGDTVNTASRMESHGIPEQIQVTESTYLLLKDKYEFEKRGEIEIKGKGKLATYLFKNNGE